MREQDGMSPIMYAARDDRHDLVQLLANLGASPHQRNAAVRLPDPPPWRLWLICAARRTNKTLRSCTLR